MKQILFICFLVVLAVGVEPIVQLANEPLLFQDVSANMTWEISDIFIGGEKTEIPPEWITQIYNLKVKALYNLTDMEDPMQMENNFVPTMDIEDLSIFDLPELSGIQLSQTMVNGVNVTVAQWVPNNTQFVDGANQTVQQVAQMTSNQTEERQNYENLRDTAQNQTVNLLNQVFEIMQQQTNNSEYTQSNILSNINVVSDIIKPSEVAKIILQLQNVTQVNASTVDGMLYDQLNQTNMTQQEIQQQIESMNQEVMKAYEKDQVLYFIDQQNQQAQVLLQSIEQAQAQGDNNQQLQMAKESIKSYQQQLAQHQVQRLVLKYNLQIPSEQQYQRLVKQVNMTRNGTNQTFQLKAGYVYKFSLKYNKEYKQQQQGNGTIPSVQSSANGNPVEYPVNSGQQANGTIPSVQSSANGTHPPSGPIDSPITSMSSSSSSPSPLPSVQSSGTLPANQTQSNTVTVTYESEFFNKSVNIKPKIHEVVWVRSVSKMPFDERPINQNYFDIDRFNVTSLDNLTLIWDFSMLNSDSEPIVEMKYMIAPLYLLNTPTQCMKTISWMLQGQITEKKQTLKVQIPLTSVPQTASFIVFAVVTNTTLYTGIKPLIVYGQTNMSVITEQFNNSAGVQALRNNQTLSLEQLATMNQNLNQATVPRNAPPPPPQRRNLVQSDQPAINRPLIMPAPNNSIANASVNASVNASLNASVNTSASNDVEQKFLNYMNKVNQSIQQQNPQQYLTKDMIDNAASPLLQGLHNRAEENLLTFGDLVQMEQANPMFSQCKKADAGDFYKPRDIAEKLNQQVASQSSTSNSAQGSQASQASQANQAKSNAIPQNIINQGCPPDATCSGNGNCTLQNPNQKDVRKMRFYCNCFPGFAGRACEFNATQQQQLQSIFSQGVKSITVVNLTNLTDPSMRKQQSQLYLENMQLMSQNQLATPSDIGNLTQSIYQNLKALPVNETATDIVTCAYNLKEQYLNNKNASGVREVRAIIDMTLRNLATYNSTLQAQDVLIQGSDFMGVASAIVKNATNQTFQLSQTLTDPVTNLSLAFPSASVPQEALNSNASSVSLSIQDCTYYPDFNCVNPVVQFTLRNDDGNSSNVTLNSSTYNISIPIYPTDLANPVYTCQWLKIQADGNSTLSTEGCVTVGVVDSAVQCQCKHLTAFTTTVESQTTTPTTPTNPTTPISPTTGNGTVPTNSTTNSTVSSTYGAMVSVAVLIWAAL